jgi:hypothetical protein
MEISLTLFKSGLLKEEVLKKFDERACKYREVKGLLQEYYVYYEIALESVVGVVFDCRSIKEKSEKAAKKCVVVIANRSEVRATPPCFHQAPPPFFGDW